MEAIAMTNAGSPGRQPAWAIVRPVPSVQPTSHRESMPSSAAGSVHAVQPAQPASPARKRRWRCPVTLRDVLGCMFLVWYVVLGTFVLSGGAYLMVWLGLYLRGVRG